MRWWKSSQCGRLQRIDALRWKGLIGVGGCLLAFCFVPVAPVFPDDQAPVVVPAVRRLGVVGFYNPRMMYVKYQQLVDYLEDSTGEPWELAVTMDYEETVRELCSGGIDVAYLGPFTYLRVHEACGATPVVRLNTKGSAYYRSLIMVRQDSSHTTLADLVGTDFAFGSPLSTSSHLVPFRMLQDAGVKPGEDINCLYFGHHDQAARAVVLGKADACGVRDIVGERFARRGLRVLARSDPIPNFPLVVRPGASPAFRRTLVNVLMQLPETDQGVRKRMLEWDEELADGFAPASDVDYLSVRRLVDLLFGRRGLVDPPQRLKCVGEGE